MAECVPPSHRGRTAAFALAALCSAGMFGCASKAPVSNLVPRAERVLYVRQRRTVLSPMVANAITNGNFVPGMTFTDVRATFGKPTHIKISPFTPKGLKPKQTWYYNDYLERGPRRLRQKRSHYIVFHNGYTKTHDVKMGIHLPLKK